MLLFKQPGKSMLDRKIKHGKEVQLLVKNELTKTSETHQS